MSNALDQAAISQFRRDGFHYPHAGISAVRAQAARADLEAHEAASGGRLTALSPSSRYKLHVKLPWAYAVASDPAILDAIESLIGPDILIFTSTMFVKEPQTDAVTLWHQDAAYFGLRPHEHVTAWVALSEASETAGCMTFLTHHGAHHKAQNGPLRDAPRLLRHKTKAQANSINGAGQSIVDVFDDRSGVRATLRVGEFSLHHTLCVHSSPPNASNDRRIGLGISYIPARVQHIGSVRQRSTARNARTRPGFIWPFRSGTTTRHEHERKQGGVRTQSATLQQRLRRADGLARSGPTARRQSCLRRLIEKKNASPISGFRFRGR
ncbi:MAG: non-heme Fe2+,alpha-ketoglutarate-dependent halogenase [Gammaproteobacteria bacterium]|jgi:non-heme Fe2+,alpha-ketoglutarate-dependent halogenase